MGLVRLLGLDFGSTTSSAMVARAELVENRAAGRVEVAQVEVEARGDPELTPFDGERLDLAALAAMLDGWLGKAGIDPSRLAGGGALVTGLAAAAPNAEALVGLVRAAVPSLAVATARDPLLESWLAFMGSAARLSERHPGDRFLNLDIGGGTTNPALGAAGAADSMGCLWVGARHLRVEPGTLVLCGISARGRRILAELGLPARVGAELPAATLAGYLDAQVAALEAAVAGDPAALRAPGLVDQWLAIPPGPGPLRVTFSGGVGELVYRGAAGEALPARTGFGDLGVLLAERILASPVLARDLRAFRPETGGRATVHGLTLHGAAVSGATVFLPRPGILPLRDLPILARLGARPSERALAEAVGRVGRSPVGGCLQLADPIDAAGVRALGEALARVLGSAGLTGLPLVLLLPSNLGKALGGYATRWGKGFADLVVLDEVPDRRARFVSLGSLVDNVVPVSFHGLGPGGPSS